MDKEQFFEELIAELHENNRALWEIHDALCEFYRNGLDVTNSGSVYVEQ